MKAERSTLSQKKHSKRDFSIWLFLGLERTLLSELPLMQIKVIFHKKGIFYQVYFVIPIPLAVVNI